ncbi:MAG: hypothetical protein WAW91_01505 [Candidatus Nanoperiomorbaceae bacterium]
MSKHIYTTKRRIINRAGRKTSRLSVLLLLIVGVVLAGMQGTLFLGPNHNNLSLTDFGYKLTRDTHTPDDLPVLSHYVALDTKHLRNIRYDDGKETGHLKRFSDMTTARST